jgi:hypothetical protein
MATLDLQMTFSPAYFALVECVTAIAASHGQERATEWAEQVLSDNIDLFITAEIEPRPMLRLIEGGAT